MVPSCRASDMLCEAVASSMGSRTSTSPAARASSSMRAISASSSCSFSSKRCLKRLIFMASCYVKHMETAGDALIRGVDLTKKFRSGPNELVIFSGMNFEVARGERLALIGESGAGKSTLLYLLGGLDRPSSGTIYFNHKAISRLSDSEAASFRNREIGFVWQNHSLLPEFTALG